MYTLRSSVSVVLVVTLLSYVTADFASIVPAPCSSELYGADGKCGGAEHGFFRCPKGYWCSQYGFCGTAKEYRINPLCPREERDDAAVKKFGKAPKDTRVVPNWPTNNKPCSSNMYSLIGKCGGQNRNFLRCPKGYWCSEAGYCGTTPDYRINAQCPRETREDPAPASIQYGFSPDDKPEDYKPQDDTEGEALDAGKTNVNCRSQKFHRWGKCGTIGHGFFRCPYGEWCDKDGYCDKFAGAAKDAVCPKEKRPNPAQITYYPAPDDDPKWKMPQQQQSMPAAAAGHDTL